MTRGGSSNIFVTCMRILELKGDDQKEGEKQIFHLFPSQVRIMISGAAPIPRHVEEFLSVTTSSVFIQGYGLTESGSGCFTCIANVFSMVGTVGVPILTIEAQLEAVLEMGYDADSDMPPGEVCLRGNSLFPDYHERLDLTDQVSVDGRFHTGDIGEWQSKGAMKIIDIKRTSLSCPRENMLPSRSLKAHTCSAL